MIHEQDTWVGVSFYAYCSCGICGPSRRSREDAKADEAAHASVCSQRVSS